MAITFKDIVKQTRSIAIELPGLGELKVTYNPGKITPEFWGRLANVRADRELDVTIGQAKIMQILEFVSAWDLMGENDKPLPITQETVEVLPTKLLTDIIEGIQKDLYPPDSNEKKS